MGLKQVLTIGPGTVSFIKWRLLWGFSGRLERMVGTHHISVYWSLWVAHWHTGLWNGNSTTANSHHSFDIQLLLGDKCAGRQECEWNGKTEPLKVYTLLGGSRSEMCNDMWHNAGLCRTVSKGGCLEHSRAGGTKERVVNLVNISDVLYVPGTVLSFLYSWINSSNTPIRKILHHHPCFTKENIER